MTNDAHGRPQGAPLVFTEGEPTTPTHADRARTLFALESTGTLSTLALDPKGYPYGTFVTYAMDEASPVFFVSRIAEHTKNLVADPRASLLVHEVGNADPLANARATLVGTMKLVPRGEAESVKGAYLAKHPTAGYYIDFDDFSFYRLSVEAIRYIGGYGRMSWIEPARFEAAIFDPIAGSAKGIIAHMNDDHADALLLYARAFTSAQDAVSATMTAIDRLGFDMTIDTPRGKGPSRVAFETPISDAIEARKALVALVGRARTSPRIAG